MKAVTAKVMLMRWLINVLLVLNLAATIAAQDEPIRVSTDIVTVPVTVLDKDGRYVTNLTKDNFKIIENGVEQDVSYFETVDKNVTVMLLLDLSGSMNDYIEPLGRSAAAFIAKLREDDRIIVAGFADDSKLHILQEPIKKRISDREYAFLKGWVIRSLPLSTQSKRRCSTSIALRAERQSSFLQMANFLVVGLRKKTIFAMLGSRRLSSIRSDSGTLHINPDFMPQAANFHLRENCPRRSWPR